MLKATVQTTGFLLELIMLVAFGWYGYRQPTAMPLKIGLAVALVAAAITIWAIWGAPKSNRRLKQPALAFFRGAMMLLAAYFIYALGYQIIALVLATIAVITQIVSCFTEK